MFLFKNGETVVGVGFYIFKDKGIDTLSNGNECLGVGIYKPGWNQFRDGRKPIHFIPHPGTVDESSIKMFLDGCRYIPTTIDFGNTYTWDEIEVMMAKITFATLGLPVDDLYIDTFLAKKKDGPLQALSETVSYIGCHTCA